MRKLIACEWMSLDGVIQSPSSPEEDNSGDFKYGGWHSRYFEKESMASVIESIQGAGGFLFGRRTYEIFAAHWPHASEQERPLAQPLNEKPKYVVSSSLKGPLDWQNSSILGSAFEDEIDDLKRSKGGDILLIGSSELAKTLIAKKLVDELRLMVDPLCLGIGKRLFPVRDEPVRLRLISSKAVSSGALLLSYAVS